MITKMKINFFYILLIFVLNACTNSTKNRSDKKKKELNVKNLYNIHCEACHGMDGTKGVSGAANLKVSKMTEIQIKNTILNGNEKGMMPYKDILSSDTEIDSLVSFVKSLRN